MQAEDRFEDKKEGALAQRADRALRKGCEHPLNQRVFMDIAPHPEPRKIIRPKPREEPGPEEGPADQQRYEPIKGASKSEFLRLFGAADGEAASTGAHFSSRRTLRPITPSSRRSPLPGTKGRSTVKSMR